MSKHVFAWVAGFGWTLMPYAPFRFELVSEHLKSVLVEHTNPLSVQRAVVTIAEDGPIVRSDASYESSQNINCVDLIEGAAFADWEHGARYDHWRVETSLFSIRWPEGFAVRSVDDAPPAYELISPSGAMIWVQGPFAKGSIPPIKEMGVPNQTTEEITECHAGPLIQLRYTHAGISWNMFHCILNQFAGGDCIVTGQSPSSGCEFLRAAVEQVAASLTPLSTE